MDRRDQWFLLEDFCSFLIENNYEKVTEETIDDFLDELMGAQTAPYVIALFNSKCEIARYLRMWFLELGITR